VVTALRASRGRPLVTWSIVALCALIWLAQALPGSPVTAALLYYPPLTASEPWRMITAVFAHGSLLHIGLNMYSLVIVGVILEPFLGRARFLVLFLLSGFGGSVAVLLLAPTSPVLGASGAVFGLFGAVFVIQRKLGGDNVSLLIVIGLNLVAGFVIPGIAWQAHVGGLIVGTAVALIYVRTRRQEQRVVQVALTAVLFAALVAVAASVALSAP
jgi:membrane associated rhomboid family serine protease